MDQCNECPHKGDFQKCQAASCSKHTSWYAKELQAQIVFWKEKAASAGNAVEA